MSIKSIKSKKQQFENKSNCYSDKKIICLVKSNELMKLMNFRFSRSHFSFFRFSLNSGDRVQYFHIQID